MAQYPINTPDGLYEAVNYLAAGPAGLGQDFQGFSAYVDLEASPPIPPGYLTGNFRKPFTQSTPANLYVADIALSNAQALSASTVKFTFASAQASAPFSQGQIIGTYDITETGTATNSFNGSWSPIGVAECTTTYVIVQVPGAYTWPTYVSGGYVYLTTTGNFFNSTDCNARVTVTGGQDRVFVSGQLNDIISYTVLTTPSPLQYTVAVNRYRGFLNSDPVNPDYLFLFDKTVSLKRYQYTGLSGTGTLDNVETIFSTIIDEPEPGYYWYIVEVTYRSYDPDTSTFGDCEVTQAEFGVRSISVQVVKP